MAKYSLMPDQQKLVEEHLYLVEIAVKQYVHAFGCNQRAQTDGFAEQNGRDAERADLTCRY